MIPEAQVPGRLKAAIERLTAIVTEWHNDLPHTLTAEILAVVLEFDRISKGLDRILITSGTRAFELRRAAEAPAAMRLPNDTGIEPAPLTRAG
jgi:hypothetical protein